jgi:hypothetical protein
MGLVYSAWTGLCLIAVPISFVMSPAWEDGTFLPGDAIFAVLALGAAFWFWAIGLVLIAGVETIVERSRTRQKLAASSGQRLDHRTRLSPTEIWTLVVVVLGSAGWLVLFQVWYDPASWLFPIGVREAAALATLLAVPISCIVWLVGVVVLGHRGRGALQRTSTRDSHRGSA